MTYFSTSEKSEADFSRKKSRRKADFSAKIDFLKSQKYQKVRRRRI